MKPDKEGLPINVFPFFKTVTAFESAEAPVPLPITNNGSVATQLLVVPDTMLYCPITKEL